MTRSRPKGHQTHKRGAEEDSPNSRRSKRRAAGDGSGTAASTTSASTLSAEELFKLKNAGEFDDAQQDKDNHVAIKDEPTGDNNQQLPSTAGPSTAPIHHARSPSVHTPAGNMFGDHSTQVANREIVLDTLLSQEFNTEMTRHAVQQILQDAGASAGSGNELGIAYIEARIARLQQKGIPSSRLSEVVHLFQTGLRYHLDEFSSRIDSIGAVSTPPTVFSAGTTRQLFDQDKQLRPDSDTSVKSSRCGTMATKLAQKATVDNVRTPLAAFQASHLQSDSSDSGSDDGNDGNTKGNRRKGKRYNSKYLTDDDEDYRDDLDRERSELTEEERSMLVFCPADSLCLCLLTHSSRSEYL